MSAGPLRGGQERRKAPVRRALRAIRRLLGGGWKAGRPAIAAVAFVGLAAVGLIIYSNLVWERLVQKEVALHSHIRNVELLLTEGHLWLDEASMAAYEPDMEKLDAIFAETSQSMAESIRLAPDTGDPVIKEKLRNTTRLLEDLERFTRNNLAEITGPSGEQAMRRFDAMYNIAMLQLKNAGERAAYHQRTDLAHVKKVFYQIVAAWLMSIAGVVVAIGYMAGKRRQAEMRLVEEERRFRLLVENARDIIYRFSLTPSIRLEYVSPSIVAVLGYTPEEYYENHRLWLECIHEDDRHVMSDIINMASDVERAVTLRLESKDGETVWMELSNSLVYGSWGEVVALEGIARDVTRRMKDEEALKLAKERAEDATALKDKFVSLVSHDLRAPLGSIIGMLRLMESEVGQKGGVLELDPLRRAMAAGDGLLSMIDKLLDISRLQTGRIRAKKIFLDAKPLIDMHIASMAYASDMKNINVENRTPEGTMIFADMGLYGEVIRNLLSNALKFLDSGDSVVFFIPEGKSDVVAIKDSGPGIDPKILPDLFKHEVKTTTLGSRGEKGTGLGLPYCRDLMEAHGGSISVESVKGEGTVFYLSLPPAGAYALVVDPVEKSRETTAELLAEIGVESVTAENIVEADGYLRKFPAPALLVVESSIAKAHEGRFIRQARENLGSFPVPALVVGGIFDAAAQADGFVAKPEPGEKSGELFKEIAGRLLSGGKNGEAEA
ncbi:MAG: PAS domain-containing sensor histidine kinase [Nitrospinae bacterium]|nr:PAS domain-containing sensor histidine kinase [Nitrospinota bacterium]